jgi:hypothetical protein
MPKVLLTGRFHTRQQLLDYIKQFWTQEEAPSVARLAIDVDLKYSALRSIIKTLGLPKERNKRGKIPLHARYNHEAQGQLSQALSYQRSNPKATIQEVMTQAKCQEWAVRLARQEIEKETGRGATHWYRDRCREQRQAIRQYLLKNPRARHRDILDANPGVTSNQITRVKREIREEDENNSPKVDQQITPTKPNNLLTRKWV